MDIGLAIPQLGTLAEPHHLHLVATGAERAGFASLWALDRVLAPLHPRTPYPVTADGALPAIQSTVLDPIVALSTAAALTERIRIGTNVLIAPFYPPILLARTAATLDRLSGGRFTLGLGLGWSADEYAAVGVPMSGRQLRIEEALEVMVRAWGHDVVEIETPFERIAASTIGLKPRGGRVPLLLAAYTPAGLERVARWADGWTPAGIPVTQAMSMWRGVQAMAERYRRDPERMRLVLRANATVTPSPIAGDRQEFVGSVAQVAGDVARARDEGVDEIVLDLQGSARAGEELLDLAIAVAAPSMVAPSAA